MPSRAVSKSKLPLHSQLTRNLQKTRHSRRRETRTELPLRRVPLRDRILRSRARIAPSSLAPPLPPLRCVIIAGITTYHAEGPYEIADFRASDFARSNSFVVLRSKTASGRERKNNYRSPPRPPSSPPLPPALCPSPRNNIAR